MKRNLVRCTIGVIAALLDVLSSTLAAPRAHAPSAIFARIVRRRTEPHLQWRTIR